MTNPFNDQFIKSWKSTNFTDWNESDVREDFIAPLLKLLGYAKNTVDHIVREENLNLQEKYHRIGRKQIAIDYIPTIRLKKFWIIEAKPGNPKTMNFGDFLQAHFYAIHPEINARFIVMINGWEIRVYDALHSNDWDSYLLLCNQENCETTFGELISTLGSNSMSAYLRKYILSTVRDTLLVEVDIEAAELLKKEVFQIYMETQPIIRQNAQNLQLQAWRKNEEKQKENLKAMPLDHLLVHMDMPVEMYAKYGKEYAKRIIEAPENERNVIYRKLKQKCYGRPHNVYRVQVIATLIDVLASRITIQDRQGFVDIVGDLISIVRYNMSYWEMNHNDLLDEISLALCHLDNVCCRVAYKSARRFAMEPLKDLVDAKLNTYSVKDLLINPPTVAREIIGSISVIQEMLWRRAMDQQAKAIWNNIWLLEDMEQILDTISEVPYSDGDQDFLWFSEYGIDYDILRLGTWMLLDERRKFLEETGIDQKLGDIFKLSRDDVKRSIPKPLVRPANWIPSNENNMSALIAKLQKLHRST